MIILILELTFILGFVKASISPAASPIILRIGSSPPTHFCNSVGTPAATSRTWSTADGSPLINFIEVFGNRLSLRNVNTVKAIPYLCTVTSALGTSVDIVDVRVAGIQS